MFILYIDREWEVHPFLNSRRVAPVLGALLKLFYPDLVGPKGQKRVAKRWEDYKWSKDEETPSTASIVKREFWVSFCNSLCISNSHYFAALRFLLYNMYDFCITCINFVL